MFCGGKTMKVVNQDKVKKYILRLIKAGRKDYVKASVEAFNISKSSVYNYLKQMENDGLMHDISIEGLGWISFVAKGQTFRIMLPKGAALKESLSKVR
jgi:hypothetical protein